MAAREKKTVSSAKPAEKATAKSTTKATTTKTAATKTTATKTTTRRATTKRAAVPVVSEAMIAERAYWISQSYECGSDVDNWLRAEAELQAA
jgi:Protein of unknown function (DUF2934)